MLGPSLSLCLLLHLLAALAGHAHARPAAGTADQRRTTSVVVRQNDGNLTEPQTVQTQSTLQTASGPMLQTCTLTFTPVTGANGEPLVQELSSCVVAPIASAPASVAPAPTSGAPTNSVASAATSDASAASSVASAASSVASAASSVASAASSGAPASASPSAPTLGTTGVVASLPTPSALDSSASSSATASSASGSASPTDSVSSSVSPSASDSTSASASASPLPSAAGDTINPDNAAGSPNSDTPTTTTSSSVAASGTSAADSTTSSAAPFKLPGTTLSVLPIGLAVFAGISVIALIVVGLVTYERTKYRRAFRQRKLAESGAGMGYGGMA